MESLRFVKRNGNKLFCFIEVCVDLFPEVTKSTVRSWLKILQIPCITCTQKERSFFRDHNPYLSGAFGLIYEEDVRLLVKYRDEKFSSRSHISELQFTVSSSHASSATSSCLSSPRKEIASSPPGLENEPCTRSFVQTKAFKPIEKVNSPRDSSPNHWNERHQTSNNHTITANATDQSLSGLENEPHCSTSQQSTKTLPAEEVDCGEDSSLNKRSMISNMIEISQSSSGSSVRPKPKDKSQKFS